MLLTVLEYIGLYLLIGFIVASLNYKFEKTFSADTIEFLDGNPEFLFLGILIWPFSTILVYVTQAFYRTSKYLSSDRENPITAWLRLLRGEKKESSRSEIKA